MAKSKDKATTKREEKLQAKAAKRGISVDELKAEMKANRQERNAAKKTLKAYMANTDISTEVEDALNLLVSFKVRKDRSGATRVSKTEAIANTLKENGSITELDLFKQFKVGRQAMRSQIRQFIKKFAPEERLWVTFDEETETYNLVDTGPNPPKGWEGYLPAEEEEL